MIMCPDFGDEMTYDYNKTSLHILDTMNSGEFPCSVMAIL